MIMLTRRSLLAATAAGAGLGPLGLAYAQAPIDQRLVVVILRGGMDGLAAVPPYADRDYRALRGSLLPNAPGGEDGALDLDGRFGLHPALEPLHRLYRDRELLVIHAAATPYRERSHFDGQDVLENGTQRPRGATDGWLNRAVTLLKAGDDRLGLAVGQSVPLILRGRTPVASWAPRTLPEVEGDFMQRLAGLYRADPVLGPALAEGLKAQAKSDELLAGKPEMGRDGVRGAQAARVAADAAGRLLAGAGGPRIAVIELGGWDTHAGENGRLAPALRTLAAGVEAMKAALGAAWTRTAVLVMTEFGRTVAVNGSGGTDHGTASAAFLIGGAVDGGRVVVDWPGLGAGRLYEGRDLAPTTDLRAVAKGLLRDHLGLPVDAIDRVVFPDSAGVQPMGGLLRA